MGIPTYPCYNLKQNVLVIIYHRTICQRANLTNTHWCTLVNIAIRWLWIYTMGVCWFLPVHIQRMYCFQLFWPLHDAHQLTAMWQWRGVVQMGRGLSQRNMSCYLYKASRDHFDFIMEIPIPRKMVFILTRGEAPVVSLLWRLYMCHLTAKMSSDTTQ